MAHWPSRHFLAALMLIVAAVGADATTTTWRDSFAAGQQALLHRDFRTAEDHLTTALDEAEAFGDSDERLPRTLAELARSYRLQGRDGDAEPLLERSLTLHEQQLPADDLRLADSLYAVADLRAALHGVERAQPLAERALSLRERHLDADHPQIADALDLLARIRLLDGDQGAAGPLLTRALTIREAAYGPQHIRVAASLDRLAELHIASRNLPEAEALLRRATKIRARTLGPDHPDNATSHDNLAQLHIAREDLEAAEAALQRALELRTVALGNRHVLVAESLTNLAEFHWSQADFGQAVDQLAEARDIRRSLLGDEHPDVVRDERDLAELKRLRDGGTPAEQPALTIKETASEPTPLPLPDEEPQPTTEFAELPQPPAAPVETPADDLQEAASRPIAAEAPLPVAAATDARAGIIPAPAGDTLPASAPIAPWPLEPLVGNALADSESPAAPQQETETAAVSTKQVDDVPDDTRPNAAEGPSLQLASFKSPEVAEAEWQRIKQAHPDLLEARELALQRIDLGERGVFYRVRTSPFADQASATAACDALRARNQDCLVVTR